MTMAGESVIHKRDILGKWGGSVPSIRPLSPEQSPGSCYSSTHLPHLDQFTTNCAQQPKAPQQWEYGSGPRPPARRVLRGQRTASAASRHRRVTCSRKETFCLRLSLSFFLRKSSLTFHLAKQRQRHPAAVVSEAWLGALELYRWRSGLQLIRELPPLP